MVLTLDEIKKLPPKERLEALREFEREQKKAKEERRKKLEEEEKEQEKATKELLKKSIDEVAAVTEEEEYAIKETAKPRQIESLAEEKEKAVKKESLEALAEEAKIPRPVPIAEPAYQTRLSQEAYIRDLSRQAAQNLYGTVRELNNTRNERGYLTQEEMSRVHNLRIAMYEKQKSYSTENDEARNFMNRTEQLLEEMQNPLRKRYS